MRIRPHAPEGRGALGTDVKKHTHTSHVQQIIKRFWDGNQFNAWMILNVPFFRTAHGKPW